MDSEWISDFKPLSTLQLSSGNVTVVFHLSSMRIQGALPQSIVDILQDPSILKVGITSSDFTKLKTGFGVDCYGTVDIQEMPIVKYRCSGNGMATLAGIFLQRRISKSQQRSQWERQVLHQPQLLYAANDALVTREIYLKVLRLPIDKQ